MTRAFKYWNRRPSRKSLSIRSKRRRGKIPRPQLKVTDAINSQLSRLIHARVFNIKNDHFCFGEPAEEQGKMTFVFSNASCADGAMFALSTRSIKCNTCRFDPGSSEATQSGGMAI